MSTTDATTDTEENNQPDDLEARVAQLEQVYERELQAERQRRKELEEKLETYEELFSFRKKTDNGFEKVSIDEASFADIWLNNFPLGMRVNEMDGQTGALETIVHELAGVTPEETRDKFPDHEGTDLGRLKQYLKEYGPEATNQESPEDLVRDDIHDAHRWMVDLNQTGGVDRTKAQNRVAHIFRRFTRKASGERDVGVDASGQTYSITTDAAKDILVEEGALDGVSKQSYSQTVARVMRGVQKATSYGVDCQCEDVDECAHALVEFNAGKPHTLSVRKQDLEEYIEEYLERTAGESGGESDDGGNSSEDSVPAEVRDDLEESRDRLAEAEVGHE